MTMQLMPHQRVGADWLKKRNRAYLGDRPRVGKTLTLATAASELLHPTVDGWVMVICPAIVRTHWRETFANECGFTRVQVFSYEEITRGGATTRSALLRNKPAILILDEAHMLKSFDAQRTKLILGPGGYARNIDVVWAASGTPVPRHPGEWYTIGSTLFPRVLYNAGIQNYEGFERGYLSTITTRARGVERKKVVGIRNEEAFRRLLRATTLQRTLDDIGDEQPKLMWQVLALDGELEPRLDIPFRGAGPSYEFAPTLRHEVGKAKVHVFLKLLLEQLAESDEKVVVFAHHRDVLDTISGALFLSQINSVMVHGDIAPKKRDEYLRRFQDDPQCRVFIGQNLACMAGIDLSAAKTIFSLEPDWVATNNDQMGHRILGINQKAKHVVAQMISLAGTIDDAIIRQNAREAAWQYRMFGTETHG